MSTLPCILAIKNLALALDITLQGFIAQRVADLPLHILFAVVVCHETCTMGMRAVERPELLLLNPMVRTMTL